MFFVIVNFFLAIIVDSYLSVKSMVETSLADRGFIADIYHLLLTQLMSIRRKWPAASHILKHLELVQSDSTTVGVETLLPVDDKLNRKNSRGYLLFYGRFDQLWPCAPEKRKSKSRLSISLNKPPENFAGGGVDMALVQSLNDSVSSLHEQIGHIHEIIMEQGEQGHPQSPEVQLICSAPVPAILNATTIRPDSISRYPIVRPQQIQHGGGKDRGRNPPESSPDVSPNVFSNCCSCNAVDRGLQAL